MNKHFFKLIISFFVFVSVIGIYMFYIYKNKTKEDDELNTSSLPVVSMIFEDTKINTLCGYTMDMEGEYMRETITPTSEDNEVVLLIDRYDNNIVNISYELRSIDTTRLIENATVDNFEIEGENIKISLKLSNMIESDNEYLLNIILVTESHEKINYYTRIIKESTPTVKKYIDYVKAFSRSTFNRDEFAEYKPSVEKIGYNDDTNFGIINNDSDTKSFTWGDLKPYYVNEPAVQVKEILGDISCIELKYLLCAENNFGTKQYYNVTEYFRVRQGASMMYVYVYERKMEQIFECNTQSVTDTRINLGIDSDLNVKISESPTGAYLSFVKERNLWCLDVNENRMVQIYSLDSGVGNDVRDKFDNSDIEIISTGKDGDVLFLVYGYMNRGAHEGRVGVGLYKYSMKENKVEELVFVPSEKSYYVLRENIGKFAYITSDNLLYLMLEDSIYTITFDSNEYVQIVSGLKEGNFIISEDNQVVAWHENGSLYNAESIRVLDIENNEDYVIEADEGEYVKVLGFVEHDLVYGTAKQSDIVEKENSETIFPMYKINVIVNDEKKTENYMYEGIYVTSVEIKDNIISLKRVKKEGSGEYVAVEDDQYINKVAEKTALSEKQIIATDLKKKELVINKAYTSTSDNELTVITPDEIVYTKTNNLTVGKSEEFVDENYYVYAYGRLYLCTGSVSNAIAAAQEHYGVVVNGNGKYVFARMSKTDSTSITGVNELLGKGYYTFEQFLNDEALNTIDVQNVSSETIFYFTSNHMPVITYLEDRGMVIISAHSGYSTILKEVEFTSLSTGEVFTMKYSEALEKLDKNKRYIVVEK